MGGDGVATGVHQGGAGELGEFAEAVLDVVDQVPPGRVTTYGRVADVLTRAGLTGGPRRVGSVLAAHGAAVAWWRVLRADGSPPVHDPAGAVARWREEGTPLLGDAGPGRRPGTSGTSVRADLSRALADTCAPDWVQP